MTQSPLRLLVAAALVLAGCASSVDGAAARDANRAALDAWRGMAPANATGYVIVEDALVSTAPTLDAALASVSERPVPAHRFLFPAGAAGDVDHVLAFLPESSLVAGRGLADALGLQIRRRPGGEVIVARGLRRAPVTAAGSVEIELASLDGRTTRTLPFFVDPQFSGPLLISWAQAAQLGLRGFEVPGTARMQVALGRPFRAKRALLRASIPALDASAVVEVLFP